MKYYVYMINCADGSFYTGYTTDVRRRVNEHISGQGSKYVRSRLPIRPYVYVEDQVTRQKAMQREAAIKKLNRIEKAFLYLRWLRPNVRDLNMNPINLSFF
jgi:putative endonuclease